MMIKAIAMVTNGVRDRCEMQSTHDNLNKCIDKMQEENLIVEIQHQFSNGIASILIIGKSKDE